MPDKEDRQPSRKDVGSSVDPRKKVGPEMTVLREGKTGEGMTCPDPSWLLRQLLGGASGGGGWLWPCPLLLATESSPGRQLRNAQCPHSVSKS